MRAAGALVAAAAVLLATPALAAPAEPHVASCEPGPVMHGSGSPGWRGESLDAGPVGVSRRGLRDVDHWGKPGSGQFGKKLPLLVEGHEPVTVSVPPRLQHRVFLYYGFHEGSDGKRSTSFYDYSGDSSIEFQPCTDKPRTIWPGGIRVKGRAPVQLWVDVEGGPAREVLRLGKPTPYDPAD